jgi:hypothetical protein
MSNNKLDDDNEEGGGRINSGFWANLSTKSQPQSLSTGLTNRNGAGAEDDDAVEEEVLLPKTKKSRLIRRKRNNQCQPRLPLPVPASAVATTTTTTAAAGTTPNSLDELGDHKQFPQGEHDPTIITASTISASASAVGTPLPALPAQQPASDTLTGVPKVCDIVKAFRPAVFPSIPSSLLEKSEKQIRALKWNRLWKELEVSKWSFSKGKGLDDFYYYQPAAPCAASSAAAQHPKEGTPPFKSHSDVIYVVVKAANALRARSGSGLDAREEARQRSDSDSHSDSDSDDAPEPTPDAKEETSGSGVPADLPWPETWRRLQEEGWAWDHGAGLVTTYYLVK